MSCRDTELLINDCIKLKDIFDTILQFLVDASARKKCGRMKLRKVVISKISESHESPLRETALLEN